MAKILAFIYKYAPIVERAYKAIKEVVQKYRKEKKDA